MALIPIFEIRNIGTYKSVDKEKNTIIMICVDAQCKQKQRYYRIEHTSHRSKSVQPVRPYSTFGTLFLFVCSTKTLQE